VRLVELRVRRLVEDVLAGPYRSVFRGRGLEFDEVRAYQPGDDVRSIDWHTTARTGSVQVKQHVEERCLTVMLAVDLSASVISPPDPNPNASWPPNSPPSWR